MYRLHVNIIVKNVDMNKSHVDIEMFHVKHVHTYITFSYCNDNISLEIWEHKYDASLIGGGGIISPNFLLQR